MRKWSLCLACLLVSASFAAKIKSPLLGKWEARPDDQTHISYEFKQDGSVFWLYEQGTIWSGMRASYRLNDKVRPIEIDLYDFADPEMAGVTIKGIVAFDGAGHVRIAASREARPSEFDASTIVFAKVAATDK
jgi:hypothetical protein